MKNKFIKVPTSIVEERIDTYKLGEEVLSKAKVQTVVRAKAHNMPEETVFYLRHKKKRNGK